MPQPRVGMPAKSGSFMWYSRARGAAPEIQTGTLLDGELVQLQEGRPELSALLRRHGLTGPKTIERAGRLHPVTYVVFDLHYLRHESLCGRALSFRRQVLADLVARHEHPRLAFSAGVTGSGRELFRAAVGSPASTTASPARTSKKASRRRSA